MKLFLSLFFAAVAVSCSALASGMATGSFNATTYAASADLAPAGWPLGLTSGANPCIVYYLEAGPVGVSDNAQAFPYIPQDFNDAGLRAQHLADGDLSYSQQTAQLFWPASVLTPGMLTLSMVHSAACYSATPTKTASPTPSATRTATRTATETRSPSPTRTDTPTKTPTASPSDTRTITASTTPTLTRTGTRTQTPAPTGTFTESFTVSPTVTETSTASPSPTDTSTVTETATPTATPSATRTSTPVVIGFGQANAQWKNSTLIINAPHAGSLCVAMVNLSAPAITTDGSSGTFTLLTGNATVSVWYSTNLATNTHQIFWGSVATGFLNEYYNASNIDSPQLWSCSSCASPDSITTTATVAGYAVLDILASTDTVFTNATSGSTTRLQAHVALTPVAGWIIADQVSTPGTMAFTWTAPGTNNYESCAFNVRP